MEKKHILIVCDGANSNPEGFLNLLENDMVCDKYKISDLIKTKSFNPHYKTDCAIIPDLSSVFNLNEIQTIWDYNHPLYYYFLQNNPFLRNNPVNIIAVVKNDTLNNVILLPSIVFDCFSVFYLSQDRMFEVKLSVKA